MSQGRRARQFSPLTALNRAKTLKQLNTLRRYVVPVSQNSLEKKYGLKMGKEIWARDEKSSQCASAKNCISSNGKSKSISTDSHVKKSNDITMLIGCCKNQFGL